MQIVVIRLTFLMVYIYINVKNLLKGFAFSQRLETHLPLTNKGDIAGNFLL